MSGFELFTIGQLIGWPFVIEARFMDISTDKKKKQVIALMAIGGSIIIGTVFGGVILSLI